MKEQIFSTYRKFVFKNWDFYLMPAVAEMVADAVLFKEQKILTHGFDPKWDSSGTLRVHPDGGTFNEADYQKLSDFLVEMTGDFVPSYESGCILFYLNYREKAHDIFSDFLENCRDQIVSWIEDNEVPFLLSLCKKDNLNEIDEDDLLEMFEELGFCDHGEVDLQAKFEKWLNRLDFQRMFRIGKPRAIKKHEEYEKKREEQTSLLKKERERSQDLFELLNKKYKLKHQEDLPRSVGRSGPCLHRIEQLIKDFNKEDREILFIHGPFSSSIRDEEYRLRQDRIRSSL